MHIAHILKKTVSLTMKATKVKIGSIKPNPNNPRIIKDDKFEKLVRSIKEFPEMLQIRPIVVNGDNIVLGGNMRLRACKEAGLKEVYIIKADHLTEEQQREFIIKDNVSGGEWDWDLIANEWDEEQLTEWGLDIKTITLEDENQDEQANIVFSLTVKCTTQEEQEKTYNDLIKQGYTVER